ncbi:MAG: hypothetical protein CO065_16060 [Comamonadaceae bacterium CG_4_9_14_0_8_um_filter_57_21]|nr:MAG: hypothetical protein CO065_16060 [Comamonadaceae bacterium CG_4_9_14_0_8_um_filter_57_21]
MKLAPELKFLCNKIATERTRPALWLEAQQLRRDALRELSTGKPIAWVQDWLHGLLAAALAAQSKS